MPIPHDTKKIIKKTKDWKKKEHNLQSVRLRATSR
jgi:hypothetical protein